MGTRCMAADVIAVRNLRRTLRTMARLRRLQSVHGGRHGLSSQSTHGERKRILPQAVLDLAGTRSMARHRLARQGLALSDRGRAVSVRTDRRHLHAGQPLSEAGKSTNHKTDKKKDYVRWQAAAITVRSTCG